MFLHQFSPTSTHFYMYFLITTSPREHSEEEKQQRSGNPPASLARTAMLAYKPLQAGVPWPSHLAGTRQLSQLCLHGKGKPSALRKPQKPK